MVQWWCGHPGIHFLALWVHVHSHMHSQAFVNTCRCTLWTFRTTDMRSKLVHPNVWFTCTHDHSVLQNSKSCITQQGFLKGCNVAEIVSGRKFGRKRRDYTGEKEEHTLSRAVTPSHYCTQAQHQNKFSVNLTQTDDGSESRKKWNLSQK